MVLLPPILGEATSLGWKELSICFAFLSDVEWGTNQGCWWECGQVGVQPMSPLSPGMHLVGHHVREREESAAHGPEPLLWGRELLHHTPGGGEATCTWAHPLLTSHIGH